MNISKLIDNLKYFHIVISLLLSIFITISLIYYLIKRKNLNSRIYYKINGCFLMSELMLLISYLIFKGFDSVHFLKTVFFIIIPILYGLDWILFYKKGKWDILDPLLWTLLPFTYFCVITTFVKDYVSIYPTVFSLSQPEMFIGYFAGMVILGYLLYFVDKIAYKLRK